ncbi:hypothetical protein RDWZM_001812 [Blomia tropicalis]|uniref:Uncharacterized protein n=1 Tax=Blomia tropicalis TaxID=40697 RepID=A0A9Q0MCU6_BLOTA|nr:hypothetical protein BLOT_008010 [Blomia tropicalis]KAJ6223267.1 hypothetical protein RDWZM_001812 [Blomia tropicalis]
MNAKGKNLLIAKYVLMVLIVLYMLNTIWVIIFDVQLANRDKDYGEEDWATKEKLPGYYANYWLAACIVVVSLSNLISLGALYGIYQENSTITMVYSCIMFIVAVYGAYDKYMKCSWTAFLVPLVIGQVGVLYASLNYVQQFEGSTLPDVAIKYVNKTKPTTPTPEETEQFQIPEYRDESEPEHPYQQA